MTKFFQVVLFIALISNLNIHLAFADVVEFKSGYSIKGKIMYVNEKVVKIRQNKVTLEINRSYVKNLTYSQSKPESKKFKTISINANKQTELVKVLKINPDNKKTTVESMKVELKPKLHIEEADTKEVSFLNQPSEDFEDKSKEAKIATNTALSNNFLNKEANQIPFRDTVKIPVQPEKSRSLEDNLINYSTLVKGGSSGTKYFGVYTSEDKKPPLQIKISSDRQCKLLFDLYSQKNGVLDPTATSIYIIFLDDGSNKISTTEPIPTNIDNFVEWIQNLENVAGVAGKKLVSIPVPSQAKYARIIGIKPDSKTGLTGYISNIMIDDNSVMAQPVK